MPPVSAENTVDLHLFRDVFNASPIGIAIESLEGQPVFVNPALCSMLGFSDEEMLSKHCVDFSPPEDAAKDWELFQQLQAGVIDHYHLDKRYLRRDGSLVWGRLSVSLLKCTPPLVVAMVEDITERKSAEDALRDSEDRFRLAQKTAGMGTFELNIKTGVNTWNRELEALYGLPPGGFGGTQTHFENLIHPDDRAGVIELVDQALNTGQPMNGEWRLLWPDGSVHWVAGHWQVFMDEEGKPSRMVGVNIDIAERKLVEQRLREYERAVEASREMITVIDREYRCLMANREYLDKRHATRDQVVGHFAYELVDHRMFEDVFKPRLDECFRGNVVNFEVKYAYPELGERDLSISYFPIEGPGGIDRVACLLLDITDRKKAEHALRETEHRFRLATQAGKMYAYEWDVASDTITRSGDVTGVLGPGGETELKRHELRERIHPDDRGRFTGSKREATPDSPDVQMSYRLLRPDGSVIWVEKIAHAFFDEHRRMVRMVGMVMDITERKRAEEAVSDMNRKLLQAQEQERARIARELHDDINQRLALLTIELAQLRDKPSRLRSRLRGLQEAITNISMDIHAVAHDLHSSQLEYLGVALAMKSWCREFAEREKIEIASRFEMRSTLPTEIGLCLFRILQQALHNAAKHGGANRIEVELFEDSGEIHLAIRDFGKGFDVETVKQGKGLGLTSMRERVRLVDGMMTIDSRPMGGTTIHVRVPLPVVSSPMLRNVEDDQNRSRTSINIQRP